MSILFYSFVIKRPLLHETGVFTVLFTSNSDIFSGVAPSNSSSYIFLSTYRRERRQIFRIRTKVHNRRPFCQLRARTTVLLSNPLWIGSSNYLRPHRREFCHSIEIFRPITRTYRRIELYARRRKLLDARKSVICAHIFTECVANPLDYPLNTRYMIVLRNYERKMLSTGSWRKMCIPLPNSIASDTKPPS